MPNWSGGASGAAGGAMAGSAFGPWGTAIGAGVGGLAGLFGGDGGQAANDKRWQGFYDDVSGRQAPQLGNAAQADYSGFRNNQSALISRLEAMSRGEGPSVSREMLNEATDRNTRGQQAMAQSGRGNAALAAQNMQNNVGMLGAQAGQSAALGRVQEQNNALQQLGTNIWSGRNSDEEMNRYNTSGRNRRDEFNVGSQMDMYGLNDRARMAAISGQQSNQPGMGDQLLAGGAGLAGFLGGQRGNSGGGNKPYLAYPGGY